MGGRPRTDRVGDSRGRRQSGRRARAWQLLRAPIHTSLSSRPLIQALSSSAATTISAAAAAGGSNAKSARSHGAPHARAGSIMRRAHLV